MATDYLQKCCDLHTELTEIRFGRRQDLGDIERAVAHVRSSRQLTYDDIEKIRDSRVWDADLFGYWPSRAEIEPILDPTECRHRIRTIRQGSGDRGPGRVVARNRQEAS